jgi:hypothetical protein
VNRVSVKQAIAIFAPFATERICAVDTHSDNDPPENEFDDNSLLHFDPGEQSRCAERIISTFHLDNMLAWTAFLHVKYRSSFRRSVI